MVGEVGFEPTRPLQALVSKTSMASSYITLPLILSAYEIQKHHFDVLALLISPDFRFSFVVSISWLTQLLVTQASWATYTGDP